MSRLININFSDDPNYRYKMPEPILKLEGRGNGAKTALTNMKALAASLHREPERMFYL